jgi:hypothetical protein
MFTVQYKDIFRKTNSFDEALEIARLLAKTAGTDEKITITIPGDVDWESGSTRSSPALVA